MGRNRCNKKRTSRTSVRKNAQHILPQINLSANDSSESARVLLINTPSSPAHISLIDKPRAEHSNIDEDDTLLEQPEQEIVSSSDNEEVDSGNEVANFSNQNQKRKTNNIEKEDEIMQKRTRKLLLLTLIFIAFYLIILVLIFLTIFRLYFSNYYIQDMQNKMFATVQDIQKKVYEIYGDWKSTGFGGHVDKNDMKWIDVSINRHLFISYII